jgi:agmatinase
MDDGSGGGGVCTASGRMKLRDWKHNAFLDLKPEYADKAKSQFVILPVAFDGTATGLKGTRSGPDAIIEASYHLEWFDEQWGDEFHRAGIYTHGHVLPEEVTVDQAQEQIYAAAQPLVAQGKTIIALGGEHSISVALVKAVQEAWPGLSVLHLDAHADLRDSYQGSTYNHACVMRRIFDLKVPSVSVGVRCYCREEHDFIKANNLTIITPEMMADDLDGSIKTILQQLTPHVYISLDIDALDSSVAPGTGTPQPGGLSYRATLALLEAVGRNRRIVGADIVEVMPIPGNCVTEKVAARLAYKIITYAQLYQSSSP